MLAAFRDLRDGPLADLQGDNLTMALRHYSIKHALAIYAHGANRHTWDAHLGAVLFAYRAAVQDSLKDAPFTLVFGREARLAIDAYMQETDTQERPTLPQDVARLAGRRLLEAAEAVGLAQERAAQNLEAAQRSSKRLYDKNRAIVSFKPGDPVRVRSGPRDKQSFGVRDRWSQEPARVVEHVFPCLYKVIHKGEEKLVNVTDLRGLVAPFQAGNESTRKRKLTAQQQLREQLLMSEQDAETRAAETAAKAIADAKAKAQWKATAPERKKAADRARQARLRQTKADATAQASAEAEQRKAAQEQRRATLRHR